MVVSEIIFLVEELTEGGFTAKALGYSIFTEGGTLEEVRSNIKNALHCHFDKDELAHSIVRLHIVKEETLAYA